jgi:putative hemolysin
MIEVKPKAQAREPTKPVKISKKYINEVFTWGVNRAKWNAAESYCADRGWKFQVMTEEHLGIK